MNLHAQFNLGEFRYIYPVSLLSGLNFYSYLKFGKSSGNISKKELNLFFCNFSLIISF
jgi:hypothetical protein